MKLLTKSLLGIGITLGSVAGVSTGVDAQTAPSTPEEAVALAEAITACLNYGNANGLGISEARIPFLADQAFCTYAKYEVTGSLPFGGVSVTINRTSVIIPR